MDATNNPLWWLAEERGGRGFTDLTDESDEGLILLLAETYFEHWELQEKSKEDIEEQITQDDQSGMSSRPKQTGGGRIKNFKATHGSEAGKIYLSQSYSRHERPGNQSM